MKVILLQDIAKVGRRYEVKDVASGHATNYLIPQKLAEVATPKKVADLAKKKAEHETQVQIQTELLTKNLAALTKVKVTISAKVNEQGHLFEGIHKEAIIDALRDQAHIDLTPDMLELEQPIKSAGEHTISVVANDQSSSFTVSVDAA